MTCTQVAWKKCVAFFVSRNGLLIHRVRFGRSILFDGELSHHIVKYLCGNGNNSHGIEGFHATPPANRLLCEACERIAAVRGLPSADEIAGYHVHVGRIRAIQTCCTSVSEGN